MKFVIYAPGDYTPNGGGCVALHKLAHNIALLGEDSYIMTSKKNTDYLGVEVNQRQATEICKDGGAMAIYPEVTCGNPFKAKHVMRWILYHVRTYGDFGKFGKDDLIYKYAPYFTLRFEAKVHGELRANELNLATFRDLKLPERSGDCYLIKKGNDKEHNAHREGAIKLDNYPSKGDKANEYLAEVFNRCERFISYDTATWLNVMAAQCGCLSIVIPDNGVNPLDFYNGYPYFKYGIAYGLTETEHAKNTLHLVNNNLLKIEAETMKETEAFIQKAKETMQ